MIDVFKIFTLGDIVDIYLVNILKIEKIKSQDISSLRKTNSMIEAFIKKYYYEEKELIEFTEKLKTILEQQWDILDYVMNENLPRHIRSEYALRAQEINKERVRWKNKINEKYGYNKEIKEYGKRD